MSSRLFHKPRRGILGLLRGSLCPTRSRVDSPWIVPWAWVCPLDLGLIPRNGHPVRGRAIWLRPVDGALPVDRYICGSGCEGWTADAKAVLLRPGPWVASCGFAGPAVDCGTGWGCSGRASRPAATIPAGQMDGAACRGWARVRASRPGRGRPTVRRDRAGGAARPASTTAPGPAGPSGRPCPGAGG